MNMKKQILDLTVKAVERLSDKHVLLRLTDE
jgi:dihydroorotate dehydrogenase electron transfer subunit